MSLSYKKLAIGLLLTAMAAFPQTKPSFEVATIKPSAPLDQAKIIAAVTAGGKLPIGASIDKGRAEYLYVDLKTLLTYAYGVKPYQISGPDFMSAARFDIVAKMPDGATKDDAPKMLQTLLEDRFKLAVHRSSTEAPVLALVVGKNGPKLKASAEAPVAIDENAPLKPGEMKTDGPEGPVRVKVDLATGSSVVDMGLKGKMAYKVEPATQSMKLEFTGTTLEGLAEMMTTLMTQLGGGASTRRVVDMTGIKGNYDATIEISLQEIIQLARAAGTLPADVQLPGGPAGPRNGPAVASDPGSGGTSVTDAVNSMGLKLESRKAVVEQFVVDHIEKAPTEN